MLQLANRQYSAPSHARQPAMLLPMPRAPQPPHLCLQVASAGLSVRRPLLLVLQLRLCQLDVGAGLAHLYGGAARDRQVERPAEGC